MAQEVVGKLLVWVTQDVFGDLVSGVVFGVEMVDRVVGVVGEVPGEVFHTSSCNYCCFVVV